MTHQNIGFGTSLLHTDDAYSNDNVAPPISVTSTFKAAEGEIDLASWDPENPSIHIYSRYSQNNTIRVEKILGALHDGHAITYASGLAAAYAALVHLKPKRIAITKAYHGVFETIKVYQKSRDIAVPLIDLDAEYQKGDIAWLETPLNPTGEARDIKYYADKAHAAGAKLVVDSTFAPPPLQNPLKWGADLVLHSATKYLGGHSDLLSGVLVVGTSEEWKQLWDNRTFFGNSMGSLEAWLLLRSLRTLHLRVARQSQTATALAAWLKKIASIPKGQTVDGVPGGVVTHVYHASLQDKTKFDPATQLTGGYGATFAIMLSNGVQARTFPHRLQYWTNATSLGGVESLIEYRKRIDPSSDPRLLRLSVGVEDLEDLKSDIQNALNTVADMSEDA